MTGRRDPLEPEAIRELAASAGLAVPKEAACRLSVHAREMLRWNRAVRLTAIEDPLAVAVKHILDSLFLLFFGPFPGSTLDFGSGAGYPGIPLAACAPESRVVLLEASAKKCAFLSHAVAVLGLFNACVLHARLEKKNPLPGEPFDHAVARAAAAPAPTEALLRRCVVSGGRILLMTGPGAQKGTGAGGKAGPDRSRRGPGGAVVRLAEEDPNKDGEAGGVPAALAPAAGAALEGAPRGERWARFVLPYGMGERLIREIRLPKAREEGGAR